jgi:truncated hemoglobin YjbI
MNNPSINATGEHSMSDVDFSALTEYAKRFSNLTPKDESLLQELGPAINKKLPEITNTFYATLQTIDKTKPFLEGRLDTLKNTHQQWLERIFSGPYDDEYTRWMYTVGDIHVKVGLPVEFMAGGMTLISNSLLPISAEICGDDQTKFVESTSAITAMLGFSLIVMQESYQASSLAAELERFLAITGMSRQLFDNLATAYKD